MAQSRINKRIAVCLDGTWQRLGTDTPTNIAKIARSVQHEGDDGVKQIVIYTPGVGAANDLQAAASNQLAGGLFGIGLEQDILDTYTRIALNYQWGDELYIFGYSRGAFSARSLAGMIRRCGIVRRRYADRAREAFELYREGLEPDDPTYLGFRNAYGKSLFGERHPGDAPNVPIRYMGIFDTVGQRGLPTGLGPLSNLFNRRYAFHNLTLGSSVYAARHALAIDETRFAFPPTPWTNLEELNAPFRMTTPPHDLPFQQRWFPGNHGDIGGAESPLGAYALAWIVEGAEAAGLAFDRSQGSPFTDALATLDPIAPVSNARGLAALSPLNWPTGRRRIRPGLRRNQTVDRGETIETIHLSAALRVQAMEAADKRYAPPNLRPFLPSLRELSAALPLARLLAEIAAGPRQRPTQQG